MRVQAKRRYTEHKAAGHPMVLAADHKAIVDMTTLFPNRVVEPDWSSRLLKSGINSRKIGSHVTKGMWAGMPIYTLTLEERATCPTICEHWHDCFGNKMHWSTRWKAGPELEKILYGQVTHLCRKHPEGVVIRLHVLGDFYSVRYVKLWWSLMQTFSNLRVFGYTRYERSSPQGKWINALNALYPLRWRIRWSERGGEMGTVTLTDIMLRGRVPEGIVCPAQTEDAACCGSCGLCWNSSEPIVFLNH